jgi:hypothetical protein
MSEASCIDDAGEYYARMDFEERERAGEIKAKKLSQNQIIKRQKEVLKQAKDAINDVINAINNAEHLRDIIEPDPRSRDNFYPAIRKALAAIDNLLL